MAANRQSRVPIDNKASLLLTSDENETVFSLLGKRCFVSSLFYSCNLQRFKVPKPIIIIDRY